MNKAIEGFMGIIMILGFITHIWTVIIAINEAGFIGAVITFLLPILSEIYWMFMMFGVNDLYAYLVLFQFVFPFLLMILSSKN